MRVLVGAVPVQVPGGGRGRPVIQNLGPGTVYLDADGDVTTDSGIRLSPGDTYEFPMAGSESDGIFIVSDTPDTDVRVIVVGS